MESGEKSHHFFQHSDIYTRAYQSGGQVSGQQTDNRLCGKPDFQGFSGEDANDVPTARFEGLPGHGQGFPSPHRPFCCRPSR